MSLHLCSRRGLPGKAAPQHNPCQAVACSPNTLPTGCGIAACLAGKLSAHSVSGQAAGDLTLQEPSAVKKHQPKAVGSTAWHGTISHDEHPFTRIQACPCLLQHDSAVLSSQQPSLHSSNKNNYHPLQHKGLFRCLGRQLRLVSVIKINCFEQAWAVRKDRGWWGLRGKSH